MRVAGVRLSDARVVWLDAGAHHLAPLDRARGTVAGSDVEGMVFVAPEQLLLAPASVDGIITGVFPHTHADPACDDLPGADLPPLGSVWQQEGVTGIVVRLDPVAQMVTVRRDDGSESTIAHRMGR